MTKHFSPEDIEAVRRRIEDAEFASDDDEFPGWIKAIIWVGLGALSWAIPIMAVYMIWRA